MTDNNSSNNDEGGDVLADLFSNVPDSETVAGDEHYIADDSDDEDDKDDEGTSDDDKDDKSDDDSGDKGDDKKDEDEEDEDEDEEEEEETDPLDDLGKRQRTLEQLKAIDADILKKVPTLRDLFYREKEYTKVFSTVEDAKAAREAVDIYADLGRKLKSGESEPLFRTVASMDKTALDRLVNDIPKTLFNLSRPHFKRLADPIIVAALRAAKNAATKNSDDNLLHSVGHLCKYLYDEEDIPDPATLNPVTEEEDDKGKGKDEDKERQEAESRAIYGLTQRINKDATKQARKLVGGNLNPEAKLPKFATRSLVEEILKDIRKQLKSDADYQEELRDLFDMAPKYNYSGKVQAKIVSAFLGRVKTLLPEAKRRVLKRHFGDVKHGEASNSTRSQRKTDLPASGSSSSAGRKGKTAKLTDFESDEDFLAAD